MTTTSVGYASHSATSDLSLWKYHLREMQDDDMKIRVHYCGICHSDIHSNRGEWFPIEYPLVAGHEFVGIVDEVGKNVHKFKVGDKVGVGCTVASCNTCASCTSGEDHLCKDRVDTYTSTYRGQRTYGGYGKYVVLRAEYAVRIPDTMRFEDVAPLLCAGITMYSPMKNNMMDRGGLRVGVVGLGGLGHMAVQWGKAMGNEVVVISRTKTKEKLAKELGATALVSWDEAPSVYPDHFDYILDTVSAPKNLNALIPLMKYGGSLITVGLPPTGYQFDIDRTAFWEKGLSFQGSCIGSVPQLQEMIDYAASKQIYPMTEHINVSKGPNGKGPSEQPVEFGANAGDQVMKDAYDRVIHSKVMFRFVIDVLDSFKDE